jgi:hypothetical protein
LFNQLPKFVTRKNKLAVENPVRANLGRENVERILQASGIISKNEP